MARVFVFLVLSVMLLSGCSGWVQQQRLGLSHTPKQFNLRRTVESVGYRYVRTEKTTVTTSEFFRRAGSPQIITTKFSDGSVSLVVWDNGVPPFKSRSANFDQTVLDLTKALRLDGIPEDQIDFTAMHSPPGRLKR